MAVAGSNSLLGVRKGGQSNRVVKMLRQETWLMERGKSKQNKLTVAACYRQFACGGLHRQDLIPFNKGGQHHGWDRNINENVAVRKLVHRERENNYQIQTYNHCLLQVIFEGVWHLHALRN